MPPLLVKKETIEYFEFGTWSIKTNKKERNLKASKE